MARRLSCKSVYLPVSNHVPDFSQALDVAIEEGIPSVEAGAQGTHKIQRGYLPSTTFSSHYVRLPKLRGLVEQAMKTEKSHISGAIEQIMERDSPYKQ